MASAELLRQIPAVDQLLDSDEAQILEEQFGRQALVRALRRALDDLRARILEDRTEKQNLEIHLEPAMLLGVVRDRLQRLFGPRILRTINATGVILHTGLGRAVLAPSALEALQQQLGGYCLLEVDRETGERGERDVAIREKICELTGAESALVVNNNAAACTLILAALAHRCEVIVSRGQLVEIGGSFRIPEVMAQSGAILREVGATNRTHLADYEQAITPETAALLLVHTSNYRVLGFEKSVPTEELASLAQERGLLLLEDLGSGALIDLTRFGFEAEPTVSEVLDRGVDVATFSGDKLLGGPQAGLIVGRADLIKRIRRHPLYRAFRVDKTTLALLEATLAAYLDPEGPARLLPTFQMLTLPAEEIEKTALRWAEKVREMTEFSVDVRPGESRPGSGSLPCQSIPTWILALSHRTTSAASLARRLRNQTPPVFVRVQEDQILIDPRTVLPDEENPLLEALARAEAPHRQPPAK